MCADRAGIAAAGAAPIRTPAATAAVAAPPPARRRLARQPAEKPFRNPLLRFLAVDVTGIELRENRDRDPLVVALEEGDLVLDAAVAHAPAALEEELPARGPRLGHPPDLGVVAEVPHMGISGERLVRRRSDDRGDATCRVVVRATDHRAEEVLLALVQVSVANRIAAQVGGEEHDLDDAGGG